MKNNFFCVEIKASSKGQFGFMFYKRTWVSWFSYSFERKKILIALQKIAFNQERCSLNLNLCEITSFARFLATHFLN